VRAVRESITQRGTDVREGKLNGRREEREGAITRKYELETLALVQMQ